MAKIPALLRRRRRRRTTHIHPLHAHARTGKHTVTSCTRTLAQTQTQTPEVIHPYTYAHTKNRPGACEWAVYKWRYTNVLCITYKRIRHCWNCCLSMADTAFVARTRTELKCDPLRESRYQNWGHLSPIVHLYLCSGSKIMVGNQIVSLSSRAYIHMARRINGNK